MVSGRLTLLWYPAGLKTSASACVWPIALLALAQILWVPGFADAKLSEMPPQLAFPASLA